MTNRIPVLGLILLILPASAFSQDLEELFYTPISNFGLDYLQAGSTDTATPGDPDNGPSPFIRDLRRFEIVSFGTFPFTLLFINVAYQMGRYIDKGANHGFDSEEARRYQPVIFGERNLKPEDKPWLLLSAVGTSILLGIIDLIIEKKKNKRNAKSTF